MNKKEIVQYHVQEMLKGLGLDLSDPNLIDTPERVARMYTDELMVSLEKEPPNLKTFPNKRKNALSSSAYDEIILFDNIPFISLCSHHLLPFSGKAWLAYIPNDKLIGASKSARLIHYFAGKPQLQEKLAMEIADYLEEQISPKGIMLVMRAVHGCMACRGIKTGPNAGMMTSVTRGAFRDDQSTRNEALKLIELSISDRS